MESCLFNQIPKIKNLYENQKTTVSALFNSSHIYGVKLFVTVLLQFLWLEKMNFIRSVIIATS